MLQISLKGQNVHSLLSWFGEKGMSGLSSSEMSCRIMESKVFRCWGVMISEPKWEDAGDMGLGARVSVVEEPFIGHQLEPFVGDGSPVGFGIGNL